MMAVSRVEPVSVGTPRGWEQQVFVHMSGKVIFSEALCCRSRRFLLSKRKTEKARCKRPFSMFSIKWPRDRGSGTEN
jgi:hypothetical protein